MIDFRSGRNHKSRFQWPRDLRRGSAIHRLLGLRVRISSVIDMSYVRDDIFCKVEVSATSRSLVQGSPAECLCVCI